MDDPIGQEMEFKNQQEDFSETEERSGSGSGSDEESGSDYSSSYYSEDEYDSEISKTQNVTMKTKANGEKTFASISDVSSAR
mgnify:FL=1